MTDVSMGQVLAAQPSGTKASSRAMGLGHLRSLARRNDFKLAFYAVNLQSDASL